MSQQDPAGNNKHLGAINPVVVASATTVNGASVDTTGWRWAICKVQAGIVPGGGGTTGVACVVASSDTTAGSFTPITGATFSATRLLAGATQEVGRVDLTRLTHDAQRWIRIQLTTTGATVSVPVSGSIELVRPDDSSDQSVAYNFTL